MLPRLRQRAPKDPYTRTLYGGKVVNWRTRGALMKLSATLYGKPYLLDVLQGSYNRGVSASGGTHDGGGAVDLSANDHNRKVCVGREIGFAGMWYRPNLPGEWSEHCHGVLRGDEEMSPEAAAQVRAYDDGKNGLANGAPDNADCHPDNVSFNYQAWRKHYNRTGRAVR